MIYHMEQNHPEHCKPKSSLNKDDHDQNQKTVTTWQVKHRGILVTVTGMKLENNNWKCAECFDILRSCISLGKQIDLI